MPKAIDRIRALAPYAPGLSIAEIQEKYNLSQVVKLASNENPLGASPLAINAAKNAAASIFRYPQGGNPKLAAALATLHKVDQSNVIIGNGSDEIIDLLIRILARSGTDNIVCFEPCFSIYPIQAAISGIETRRQPLEKDFSFNCDALLAKADSYTKLLFITTPDNPSGYCPALEETLCFVCKAANVAPEALVVIDEAYMDFAGDEKATSLLANNILPDNVAFLRTFSKSWGLAGMRIGYGILPPHLADAFWRARLPFSVNIIAEAAALAAMEDTAFRKATLEAVSNGRKFLVNGLKKLGCHVWPSSANFLMFRLPENSISARQCFDELLSRGIIIRMLKSYGLDDYLRVSIGSRRENTIFLDTLAIILKNDSCSHSHN